ncbi:hypothetical protein CBS101457_002844 [Exobasidium rhododendri]|nr:hypothetical protein CBS101457_002844 [Exobasidium rhododendri]
MKINEETVLVGSKVVLVPYRKEHVEKYHEWMSSDDIRQQTASEPLTIAEEYEMQRSWQEDEDKLTFIMLARLEGELGSLEDVLQACTMVGDVNLFLTERHEDDKDNSDDKDDPVNVPHTIDAELEVMIAEKRWRQKGLAAEALMLLIKYASSYPTPAPTSPQTLSTHSGISPSKYLPLPSDAFLVKIGYDNQPSIRLFEKLGFEEVKRSAIWKEVEMRPVDGGMRLRSLPGPSCVLRWGLP